jgi:hypothetical protein
MTKPSYSLAFNKPDNVMHMFSVDIIMRGGRVKKRQCVTETAGYITNTAL